MPMYDRVKDLEVDAIARRTAIMTMWLLPVARVFSAAHVLMTELSYFWSAHLAQFGQCHETQREELGIREYPLFSHRAR